MRSYGTEDIFNEIDDALRKLGKSDSSIQYATHIREEFSNVVQLIDILKSSTRNKELIKGSDWYFK